MFTKKEELLCRDCFAEGALSPIQIVRDADGMIVKNENGDLSYACAGCGKVVLGSDTVLTMRAAIIALWTCLYGINLDALKESAQAVLLVLDEQEAKQKAEEEANPKLKLLNMVRTITGL